MCKIDSNIRYGIKQYISLNMEEKACTKCGLSKSFTEYHKDRTQKSGLSCKCKECTKEKSKSYSKRIKEKNQETPSVITELKCSKCNQKKSVNDFYKDIAKISGYNHHCKECCRPHIQRYFENNRDEINKRKAKRRENPEVKQKENEKYKEYYHRPEIKQRYEEYRNKPETQQRMEEYRKDPINKERKRENDILNRENRNNLTQLKYKTDIDYRMKQIIRARINKALTRNKINSSIEYLGCDINFLRQWLEFRFDDQMTWENFGEYWHIDHILPVAAFEIKDANICFHWTNLQPLSAKENIIKKDKLQLHYFWNNIVNVYRFYQIKNTYCGYQAIKETLSWLRIELKYGKNASYEITNTVIEMDNPQPSL